MHVKRMNEQEYMERVSGLFEKVRAESAVTENEAILFDRYREPGTRLSSGTAGGPPCRPSAGAEAVGRIKKEIPFRQFAETGGCRPDAGCNG